MESNEKLAKELDKPIIRKFKNRVYSGFKDTVWGADLAHLQLISKFNKGFRFWLCVFDSFSKYAWVVPLKDRNGVTITNAFQKKLKESNKREILMVKKLLEHFMKKNCKRLIKKNLGLKRWLNEKEINYVSNGKVVIIRWIVGLIKKI